MGGGAGNTADSSFILAEPFGEVAEDVDGGDNAEVAEDGVGGLPTGGREVAQEDERDDPDLVEEY